MAAVLDDVRDEYFELLRFPSVGADPAHFRDTLACASWLRRWLAARGFGVRLVYPDAKPGAAGALPPPPVVFAERRGAEGAPTVLVYGHYDVQPADPPEVWTTPPFEPTERDGRVWCRGAQDDKGQFFAFLCGLRDFLGGPDGARAPTVKVVIDGQEESGSAALAQLLADGELRRAVAADVLLVCDTSASADLRPAIVAGLRGVTHFTVRLAAAKRDLHSGEYGGLAPNAAQGLCELLASLHGPDGAVAVAGFADGLEPPTDEEVRLAEAGSPDAAAYAEEIGCEPAGGAAGHSPARRLAFEPTIEVNGIHAGYGGPGGKTVIPCSAFAKLSVRLVPGQTSRGAYEAIVRHLEARVPKGMRLTIDEWTPGAGGFRLPLGSPAFVLAEEVLREMDPRGPVFVWDGASIPVLSHLRAASCAAPLIVGWGQPEDRIHAPNESYSLRQFALAREWARRILAALARNIA